MYVYVFAYRVKLSPFIIAVFLFTLEAKDAVKETEKRVNFFELKEMKGKKKKKKIRKDYYVQI